ncbi:restriction endonuclease subunit S [Streptomyces sp. NEAU-L66]|uniref:restriction endonuclease subunit S n=1 Tax=Streptomyces sp. NEAU-L66 TaxID=3390812 RepID=UPI0039C71BDF
MNDWGKYRLGDLIKVRHGFAFAGDQMTDQLTGAPIVVSIGNFSYTGGFRFGSTRVREFRGDYPEEFELDPDDLLVIMTCQTEGGEILGIPALVPDDGKVYLHNQRIGRVECDESRLNKRFAYYLFLSSDVNRQLFNTASGTKILHTSPSRISEVQVVVPDLRDQCNIAKALGALDDKIAVNERIAATALHLGKALYRRAAESSRESAALGDLIELKYGKALPAARRESGPVPVFGSGGVSGSHNKSLVPGPGVVVGRKGTVGAVYWSQEDFFPIDTTFYVSLKSPDFSMEYVYFALQELGLEHMNSDSAVPGLNRANALALRVETLAPERIASFTRRARQLFDLKNRHEKENGSLADLRDTLLPQLMSGKIRVRDAEKIVEDAV